MGYGLPWPCSSLRWRTRSGAGGGTEGECEVEAFAAFAQANWPYAAAAVLLYFAWLFWTLDHAPELPWHT